VVLASNGFMLQRPPDAGVRTWDRRASAEPFQQSTGVPACTRAWKGAIRSRVLRVLRYDNRADPTQIDTSPVPSPGHAFNSAGLRRREQHGRTGIRNGSMARPSSPRRVQLVWPFRAQFALLSSASAPDAERAL